MTIKEELERLDRAVKDAELRIRNIKSNLDAVDREVERLTALKGQLDENIKYLKRDNIIALALEFRKAKAESARVKDRLIVVINDRANISKAHTQAETILAQSKVLHAKLQEFQTNNVIPFRRKNG